MNGKQLPLDLVMQGLAMVFTQPTFMTHQEVFLGWIMCLGHRTEFRVFEAIIGRRVSHKRRHPFDRFYNFFSRSAWSVRDLAHQVAVQLVTALNPRGELHLIVDATLLHKWGKHVWNIGWFHDAVASTEKRTVTALGNKWVVLGLVVPILGTSKIFCLPIHAMLQPPGKGKSGEPELARKMLEDVLSWFPDRKLLLVGDGGYSGKKLLGDLDERVRYVGLMRGDAALHDVKTPRSRRGKPGRKPKKGPRLPSPREVAKMADRGSGRWRWKTVEADAFGEKQKFTVCSFVALWPRVFGQRPIRVVVFRSLEEGSELFCLYTTDLEAAPQWVIETYGSRVSIEAMFKNSKQVLEIQKPQHWCKGSVEKLAPWVWMMQSMIAFWYITAGRKLPEAHAARRQLGNWESEWSFRHMCRLLRRITIRDVIRSMSHNKHDLQKLAEQLENYLYLAA
jgi:hypothetical protein